LLDEGRPEGRWRAPGGRIPLAGRLRTPAGVKRRVALDMELIEPPSTWLDIKIPALTGPRLPGDGSTIR
jgi:hypothetical protein